jgi:hypothetical protein
VNLAHTEWPRGLYTQPFLVVQGLPQPIWGDTVLALTLISTPQLPGPAVKRGFFLMLGQAMSIDAAKGTERGRAFPLRDTDAAN